MTTPQTNPSFLRSRLSALYQSVMPSSSPNDWALYRLLSGRRLSVWRSTYTSQISSHTVVLKWAQQCPDWPLSKNQVEGIKELVSKSSFVKDKEVFWTEVVSTLTQAGKFTTLISMVSHLNRAALSHAATQHLLVGQTPEVLAAARPIARVLAHQHLRRILNDMKDVVYTPVHAVSIVGFDVVWLAHDLDRKIQDLVVCLDFMGLSAFNEIALRKRIQKLYKKLERGRPLLDVVPSVQDQVSDHANVLDVFLRRHALINISISSTAHRPAAPEPVCLPRM